jgi:hypothetical protein
MENRSGMVEHCTEEQLSVAGIRQRIDAFNFWFGRYGGYKSYELQAIEVLLRELDRLRG